MADIEQNLKEFIKELTKDKGYADGSIKVQAISSEGANYTSSLYLVTVSAPFKEDLNLFAKVANTGEKMRADTSNGFNLVYIMEKFFYTEIAVAFEKLYNKNGVPEENRLYIPKFYGFKSNELQETVVLENLAAKGYGDFDRFKTFNWEYASKAVEELAKFHALGLAYREENPEELDKVTKLAPAEYLSENNLREILITQAIKIGTESVKEEYRGRMKIFFEKNDTLDQLKKFWHSPSGGFLIHGDYKPSNLMHKRLNGKIHIVPLDYQMYRLGLLTVDLMYFIFSGSDAHFRKHHYQNILEHYYKELTRALQDLHVDINKVYSRKVFEHELEETKTAGLFLGLLVVPLLTVEPENAPKIESFGNLIVAPNQLALDRVNDIIADYIRWGIV